MASRTSIEFDFKQAMMQADRVDEIADSLSNLSGTKFQNTTQVLAINWKGDSASKYISKGGRLQNKMEKTANDLRDTADDIRKVAKALYDAEMAALDIATRRDY